MNGAPGQNAGWHASKADGSWKGGPYTYEQISAFAREGRITPNDLVFPPKLGTWVPAREIAGLFPSAAAPQPQPHAQHPTPAQQQPAPQTRPIPNQAPPPPGGQPPAPRPVAATQPPPAQPRPAAPPQYQPRPPQQQWRAPAPQQPATPRRSRKGWIVAVSAIMVFVLFTCAGGGAWLWFSRRGGLPGVADGGDGPDLGTATVKLPDEAALIETEQWRKVPANQIGIVLKGGADRNKADALAASLGGSVVGEVEYIGMYQIEFPGKTEQDLRSALDTAKADANVELAFPNQDVPEDAEIWGVRVDPYNDPMYGNGAGDGYNAVGVSRAWSYIRGSQVDLHKVKVGINDNGLYRPGEGRESEFGGDVEVSFPDGATGELAGPRTYDDGSVDPSGSHGTGVATIIGADAGNGGPTGIAGPLGKNLQISVIDRRAGQYGFTTATPDPNDPTKMLYSNGQTYSIGNLVALKNQIAAGSRVINCSWGDSNADPQVAAAYKKFFTQMAADHPEVLFVCSAGNVGKVLDGDTRYPSGLALPNMITVGWLNNDGTKNANASMANGPDDPGGDYEVTIAAPGTNAVVGMDNVNGGAVQQSGSSFATPHVTAAAALLLSIKPNLTAGDIKKLLTDTARPGITVGGETGTTNLAPPELGGGVLAIDQAVLAVINMVRKEKGLAELTPEMLEKMGVVDAVAITGEPGEYTVKGIIGATGEDGTGVKIEVTGEDYAIGGDSEQNINGEGEVQWDVTLPKDSGTIKVTRTDCGAASVINIERIDINGNWSGTFTVTDVTITDQEAAEEEGCSLVIVDALKGKALPMTLDVTVDESGQGSGVMFIDVSVLNEGNDEEDGEITSSPQTVGISYSGDTVTFTPEDGSTTMSAKVRRDGDSYVMQGTAVGNGSGWQMKAAFTLSMPAK